MFVYARTERDAEEDNKEPQHERCVLDILIAPFSSWIPTIVQESSVTNPTKA